MFNIDRWLYYSKQRGCGLYNDRLLKMTPAQLRRCRKKARQRNDGSLGSPNINK